MTTTRVLSIAAALTIACVAPALGQPSPATTRIGFGVALTNNDDVTTPAFEVPIDIGAHLRVQPEFRYQHAHDNETDSVTYSGRTQSDSLDETSNTTWFGASVLYLGRQDRIAWHVGGKVGLIRSTVEEIETSTGVPSQSHSATTNGYFAGAVFGGEYFLHDRFSLGVTISTVYESADASLPQTISSITYTTALTSQHFATQAAFTARVYLK